MRLTRKSRGHYVYGEFEIIHDAPQFGVSVGTGNSISRWNVYRRGEDDPVDRFVALNDVRIWLDKHSAAHPAGQAAEKDVTR